MADAPELLEYPAAEKAFWAGDYAQAIPSLEKLLAERNHHAALLMAQAYQHGLGVKQDLVKSVSTYRSAVDMGSGFAAMMLAMNYNTSGATNPPEMRQWLPHDPAKGARYLQMARKLFEAQSAQGDAAATQGLANLYEFGMIQPLDLKKALELYKKAYDLGALFAANNLAGLLYDVEDPEIRNVEEARKWYDLARKHGILKVEIEEFDEEK